MRPAGLRSLSYWAFRYRRMWRGSIVSGTLTPIAFLAAMGVGLGHLVPADRAGLDHVGYLAFIAPGLLAASAMQVAVAEGSWPVMEAVKWNRQYQAMLATPLGVTDVFHGHLGWIVLRCAEVAAIFLAVMSAFGLLHHWSALLALPAAVLTGAAFAAPVLAFSVLQDHDSALSGLYRFGVVPLFLFSGTFFPVRQLPAALRPLAYASPLWHGVALCRELVLAQVDPGALAGHVGYLLAVAGAGVLAGRWAYHRRLQS